MDSDEPSLKRHKACTLAMGRRWVDSIVISAYSTVVQEGQPEVSPVGKAQKLQLTIILSLNPSL